MTGINHTVTGVVIGSAIGSPLVALPIAFASHFILDLLPHWGDARVPHASRTFKTIIIVDTVVTTLFLIAVLIAKPKHWLTMIVAGLIAMSPDLMWLPNFIRTIRKRTVRSYNKLMHFHENMQIERPWGIFVEAVWLLIFMPICIMALR